MNVDFKVAMIRENIKTMVKSQSKKEIDFVFDFIIKDLKELRDFLKGRIK